MITRFEAVGIFTCIALMVLAIYLLRVDSVTESMATIDSSSQVAATVVAQDGDQVQGLSTAILDSIDEAGEVNKLIIDDVTFGAGAVAKAGDTVRVHYVGRLRNGQEFDNSYKRGEPIEFELGAGRVIAGWEEGIVGMQEGGERVLVIPPAYGYGNRAVGPIPAGSTLVFLVELVEIL